ncbi:MAG: 3TM-type holin [Methylococcales bacterium]|nr:3TM-type holin [Methylococcales bacterium]
MFGIDDAIAAGSNLITTITNKIAPDANIEIQGKINSALTEMQNEYASMLAQVEVNKVEAASTSVFVGGWRPAIGWICGAGLAYAAVIEPLGRFIAVVFFDYAGTFPVLNAEITLQILLGMLGLGGMRSYDKKVGTSK